MSGRRDLTTPRWLLTHLVVVALAVACVLLGLWQLRRLGEVRAENDRIEARLDAPAEPLAEVLSTTEDLDGLVYRRVTATGRYVAADEVLLRSRSHRGRNGWHVLTPLRTGPDGGVLVRRGWVPYDLDEPPVTEAAPPDGEVEVTGFLQRPDEQPGFGPTDPETGVLERVFHADVGRIDRQTDVGLSPVVLQLTGQSPEQSGRLPIPADTPDLDESRHLSYAIQWFSFAAIAIIGYGVVIRRQLRGGDDGTDGTPAAGPATRTAAGARRPDRTGAGSDQVPR